MLIKSRGHQNLFRLNCFKDKEQSPANNFKTRHNKSKKFY